ncbi:MAG TPA: hypothetical protein VHD36_03145 [Pirellulales bacterium]|nr:hypothetical protein [Pirellulales bacterium]
MEYNEALSQISEIHAHLAKGEIYRGFRSIPVAISGLVGFAAALLAPRLSPSSDLFGALEYWVVAGVICGLVGFSETAVNYVVHEDAPARRRSRRVLGQFVPGLVAGTGLTWCIARAGDAYLPMLPGLWAVVFGLAIFSARPYLPRASGWVALWYLAAGLLWISIRPADAWQFAWIVAGTFGIGQFGAAVVLFWNVERLDHV